MSGAVRSMQVELRRRLEAANRGRDVLEQKRELILRELHVRRQAAAETRVRARTLIEHAHRPLISARIELGTLGVEAAVLAQPETASVEWRRGTLMGIELPKLTMRPNPFVPRYGPAATCGHLDQAGAAFAAVLPELVRLAQEELAVRALRRGLSQTTRRLSALEQVVIPQLERDLRELLAALEEEDRDEFLRRKRWLDVGAEQSGGAAGGAQ